MMRVLIAEDDEKQLRYLSALIREGRPQWSVVAEVSDPKELGSAITTLDPSVCVMDVKLAGTTSFEVIQSMDIDSALIFTTGDSAAAAKAFDHAAVDFVPKPIRPERLELALQRAEAWLVRNRRSTGPAPGTPEAKPQWVRMLRGLDVVCAPLTEVRYFQAQRKYTRVILKDSEGLLRSGFGTVQAMLESNDFWQVHRGVLVNIRHLAAAKRDELGRIFLTLVGRNEKIMVARPYEHLFKDGLA